MVATGAISYALVSGSLPSGLTLSSGGVISGTPANIIGGYSSSFTVQATGTSGSANQSFVLYIAQASSANYDPYSEQVILSMPMTGTSGSTFGAAFQDNMSHTVNIIGSPYVNTVTTYNGLGEVPAVYFPAGSYFSIL